MGIQRYDCAAREVYSEEFGEYVLFTDHEQVVAEMTKLADGLSNALEDASLELVRLRAELAAKSKDAARYVWLRDHAPEEWDISIERGYGPQNDRVTEVHVQDYLDEAIDSAMGEGNDPAKA